MEKEGLKEGEGIALLTFGGGEEREVDAEGGRTESGAIAEADLAEDDGESEALFGVMVGRFHTVDVEESKKA